MILDGYNVIHRVPAFRAQLARSADAGRRALLAYCAEWMALRRDVSLFLVVMDGGPDPAGGQGGVSPGVRVIYSKRGQTADDRIHSLLQEWTEAARCVVVSDDGEVARRAKQVGAAEAMSAQAFAEVLRRRAGGAGQGGDEDASKSDLTPGQAKAITDELRRLWGG